MRYPLWHNVAVTHFWNQDNFEFLEQMAQKFSFDPAFQWFVEYCTLKAQGLRKPAMAKATAFAKSSSQKPLLDRIRIIEPLILSQYQHPNIHWLLPHPIHHWLIQPTLKQWQAAYPTQSAPWRWYGYFYRDRAFLRKALECDPSDEIARYYLIEFLLGGVDYAFHHLPDFLVNEGGDEEEIRRNLIEIQDLLKDLPSSSGKREFLEIDFLENQVLLEAWLEFSSMPNPPKEKMNRYEIFSKLCRKRGLDFRPIRSFPYRPR